ncbi:inositol monophosphatase family protein [Actinopolymorpha alba]|uniref:inositol monophosphatase family protein n=1 Tax=Actinopolymorpha alba TaxID=533267 RepID=UPI00035C5CD1|nr:inositol monophosphatase family protein [Actinopolymorpha alba]
MTEPRKPLENAGNPAAAPDPAALLVLAEEVAREAGELLLSRRRTDVVTVAHTKSSPTDVVTAMDTAAERLIRERLLAARPDDAILGEEGGSAAGDSGVRWIVDPLDGTVNYLYGLPVWGVSIAAEVDGTVVAGAVACPPTGEMWTARRGGGAFLDGTPIRANPVTDLGQALVGTGFWYAADLRARQAELLREILPRVRDIRRIGSAAVDLCGVACGRLDGFYETGLHPWDLAAGVLVAEEAGARSGGIDAAPADRRLAVAAAPGVFEDLHSLIMAYAGDVLAWVDG